MSWWLLQQGTTRSHLELGRETCSRQWYFGLSRGRVGLCQLFLEYPLPITLPYFFPPSYISPHTSGGILCKLKNKKVENVILEWVLLDF